MEHFLETGGESLCAVLHVVQPGEPSRLTYSLFLPHRRFDPLGLSKTNTFIAIGKHRILMLSRDIAMRRMDFLRDRDESLR